MIPRYARPEMARIWTQDAKYEAWLQVELAVCDVYAKRGADPGGRARPDQGAGPGAGRRASTRSRPPPATT